MAPKSALGEKAIDHSKGAARGRLQKSGRLRPKRRARAQHSPRVRYRTYALALGE